MLMFHSYVFHVLIMRFVILCSCRFWQFS